MQFTIVDSVFKMVYYLIYLLAAIGLWIAYQKHIRRNLPPGPIPWPLIGNVIEIARVGRVIPEILSKLSRKYGSVYSITVGASSIVVVNGAKAIRGITKTEDYDNRIGTDWLLDRSKDKVPGLLFSSSSFWKDTRQTSFRVLKNLGFMKPTTLESCLQNEFEEFIQNLKTKVEANDEIFVHSMFGGLVANAMLTFLMGSRYNVNDSHFQEIVQDAESNFDTGRIGVLSLHDAFPFMTKHFPEWSGFKNLHSGTSSLHKLCENAVKVHRESGEYKNISYPTNFLNLFLREIDTHKQETSNLLNDVHTDANLAHIMKDLFQAGTDTTSTILSNAVKLMVLYPHVQAKVREEIDSVVGIHRMAKYEEKSRLRYTEATMMEILRSANSLQVAPRRAEKFSKYERYQIPEGTIVLLNYRSAQMDESVWRDPHIFRPERFLNDSGDIINSDKLNSILFGAGKRNCVGEVSARVTFFVGLTSLIQNFIFEIDPKCGLPNLMDDFCFSSCPTVLKIRVECRKEIS